MVDQVTDAEQKVLPNNLLNPHPDGKPWDKCCGTKSELVCMCLMRKPTQEISRYQAIIAYARPGGNSSGDLLALEKEGGRFFCVHRTDEGYNRECAGWSAKRRMK